MPNPARRSRASLFVLLVLLAAAAASALLTAAPVEAQSRYSTSEAREQFLRGSELERRAGEAGEDEALLEEAAEAYVEAVERDPQLLEAWSRLGFVLLLLERADEAVERLTPVQAANPRDLELKHALGVSLFAVDRDEEAAALLEQVAAERDDLPDVQFLLGMYHLEGRRDEVAVGHFERYRELAPDDLQGLRALATLQLRGRDWPAAQGTLERLLQLAPDDLGAHLNLGHVHYAEQRPDLAAERYQRVLELDPARVDVRYDLASVYYLDGDCARATPEFDRVIETNARHFGALYFRADCALLTDQLDDAERRFTELVEARPGYLYGYLKLAVTALRRGDREAATGFLARADLSATDKADVLLLGGRVQRRLGELDAALATHGRLVEMAPDVGEHHVQLGLDLLAAGRTVDAVAELEQAVERDPTHPTAWQALSAALIQRAADVSAREPGEATSLLERVVELDHHPLEARVNLALLALSSGDARRARTLLDEAREIDANAPAVARLDAALLVRDGRLDEAVSRLEPLAARDDGADMTAASWSDLAVARAGSGDWTGADDAIERAVEQGGAEPRHLALIKYRLGVEQAAAARWSRAEAYLDDAWNHVDALTRAERLRLEYALGVAALQTERFGRAERYLARVRETAERMDRRERREVDDALLDVDFELAYAQYRSSKLADAAELLGEKPRGEAARLMRAVREALAAEALEAGKVDEARRHLELAAGGDSASTAARLNLAVVQYEQGEPQKAAAVFEKLADKGVPEAMIDYALYLDEVAGDPAGAMRWYERYVEAGGRLAEQVESRLAIKRRVWGPDGGGL